MAQQRQHEQPTSNLIYRVEVMERDLASLKSQLSLYEPARENDLKLQRINDTVSRIETELSKVKEKLETMNTHMTTQEAEAQKRDSAQKEQLANVQISGLKWGVGIGVGFVVSALLLLLGAYFTHIIH